MLLAFSYIDWMSPLTHSFILIKILLLPAVAVYALAQRRKFKKTGIPPHESEASLKPRPLWVNHTLENRSAPEDSINDHRTPDA